MSATLDEAVKRIYETFITDWAATSPFTLDNEDYTPPKPTDDWVRVAIRHSGGGQASLGDVGNRKFDRFGSVFVQCFTPIDKGRKGADTLAAVARTIFEGKTLSPESIRFTSASVREIGPERGWYQVNMEASFNYTETK